MLTVLQLIVFLFCFSSKEAVSRQNNFKTEASPIIHWLINARRS